MDIEIVDFNKEGENVTMIKDGKETKCDVLFTFECEDTMRCYVGFTDHSIASNGRKIIYVQSYDPFATEIKFENIVDERELKMVNDVLMKIDESNQ